MKVFIDGCCEPNPGKMGIGIHNELFSISENAGEGTNNQAEYIALEKALLKLQELGIRDAEIYTDSQLVVNQMNGNWELKSATSLQFVPRLRKILNRNRLVWIPREQNKEADFLSASAIGFAKKVPSSNGTDFYVVRKDRFTGQWKCECKGFQFRQQCKHIVETENKDCESFV